MDCKIGNLADFDCVKTRTKGYFHDCRSYNPQSKAEINKTYLSGLGAYERWRLARSSIRRKLSQGFEKSVENGLSIWVECFCGVDLCCPSLPRKLSKNILKVQLNTLEVAVEKIVYMWVRCLLLSIFRLARSKFCKEGITRFLSTTKMLPALGIQN